MATNVMDALRRSNLDWIADRTIFLARHGSHAYGTSTPTSDEDFKGLAIPPVKYFNGYLERFEQAEFRHQDVGLDAVIYDIRKFFKLAADCNPSIIEVLFTEPEDFVVVSNLGQQLLNNRQLFVSKKAKHTFSGYAMSQLKRIKTHYRWLKNPPKAPPTRAEYGLPERTVIPADQLKAAEAVVRKQIEQWNIPVDELDEAAKIAVKERFTEALTLIQLAIKQEHKDLMTRAAGEIKKLIPEKPPHFSCGPETCCDGLCMDWHYFATSDFGRETLQVVHELEIQGGEVNLERVAGKLLGFSDNFLELLDKERTYKGRVEEWRSYQNWLATRNASRSALEAKYGYDTKHGMHLVRLLRMGREIITSGRVIVKRPDAQELLSIRNGAWSYEQLLDYAETYIEELDQLYATCTTVPNAPDRVKLDQLCQYLVGEALK